MAEFAHTCGPAHDSVAVDDVVLGLLHIAVGESSGAGAERQHEHLLQPDVRPQPRHTLASAPLQGQPLRQAARLCVEIVVARRWAVCVAAATPKWCVSPDGEEANDADVCFHRVFCCGREADLALAHAGWVVGGA